MVADAEVAVVEALTRFEQVVVVDTFVFDSIKHDQSGENNELAVVFVGCVVAVADGFDSAVVAVVVVGAFSVQQKKAPAAELHCCDFLSTLIRSQILGQLLASKTIKCAMDVVEED
jgi:hypothetical protein